MLVLWLMFEARKPENWAFMGFQQADSRSASEALPDDSGESVDTRFFPQLGRNQDELGGDQDTRESDTPESAEDGWAIADLSEQAGESIEVTLLGRTRRDFWKSVYQSLTSPQRQLLFIGMQQGRLRSRFVNPTDEPDWLALVDRFAEERAEYEQNILQAITALPPDETRKRELWTDILQQMQTSWASIEPALRQVPAGTTDAQADTLQELQTIFDEISLGLVEDDSLRSRLEEREAWYRQFERLRAFDLQNKLDNSAAPNVYQPVSFLQLFKQPDVYRGAPVQVRGKVYLAQYQVAQENPFGLVGYHVLWIRPEGTAESPIQVYALRMPEGFPSLPQGQSRVFDAATAEQVVVDGVFFKRVAYEGQDGFRLAPLVLTLEPTWIPQERREPVGDSVPSWPVMVAVCLGVAILAVGIAVFAMRFAAQQPKAGFRMPSSATEPDPATLARLMSEQDRGDRVDFDEEESS